MRIGFDRNNQTKNSRIFGFGLNSINTRRNIAIFGLDLFFGISIELTFSTWIDWQFFDACNLLSNMYNIQWAMHTMHHRVLVIFALEISFEYYFIYFECRLFFLAMELYPFALISSISIKMSINFLVMHKFQAKYVRK